jgi:hypothetical protein
MEVLGDGFRIGDETKRPLVQLADAVWWLRRSQSGALGPAVDIGEMRVDDCLQLRSMPGDEYNLERDALGFWIAVAKRLEPIKSTYISVISAHISL